MSIRSISRQTVDSLSLDLTTRRYGVWDVTTGNELSRFSSMKSVERMMGESSRIWFVKFHSNECIAAMVSNGLYFCWNWKTGKHLHERTLPRNIPPSRRMFSPDRISFALAYSSMLYIADMLCSREEKVSLPFKPYGVVFTLDSQVLVSWADDGTGGVVNRSLADDGTETLSNHKDELIVMDFVNRQGENSCGSTVRRNTCSCLY